MTSIPPRPRTAKLEIKKLNYGLYAVDLGRDRIGEVRHFWAPSAIRRGRTQGSPLWRAFRYKRGVIEGPISLNDGRSTRYEFLTRKEAVAVLWRDWLIDQP